MPPQTLLLLDSISNLDAQAHDCVVVSGSHGGSSAARFVLQAACKPRLVLLNDAGVGKDHAGIAALGLLNEVGVACACYAHTSARIGEAQDALWHGVISHANPSALALGVRVGDLVSQWAPTTP